MHNRVFLCLAAPMLASVSLPLKGAQAVPLKIEQPILLPDGKPAAGAKVLLRTLNPKDGTLQQEKRIVVGEDGVLRGEIEGTANTDPMDNVTGYLVVDVPGMALAFEKFSNLRKSSMGTGREPLRLSAGYEIKGKVLDVKGEPLAGSEILLAAFNSNWGTWRINWPTARISTPEATTKSGADGLFALRPVDIVEETYGNGPPVVRPTLVVRAKQEGVTVVGFSESFASRADPSRKTSQANYAATDERAANTMLVRNTIRLYPTSRVRGRILNALNNKPVAGAQVELRADPPYAASALISPATTAPDGSFEWNGVPASFQLFAEARHPDFASGWTRIGGDRNRISADSPVSFENSEIKLRPLATATGKVIDVETNAPPMTPISIGAIYEEGYNDGRISVGRGSSASRMNPDGTFTMKMPVGYNHLNVRGPGYSEGGRQSPIDLDIKPGNNSNLILPVRKEKGFLVHFSTSAAQGKPDYNYDLEYDLHIRGKDGKESSTNWSQWWYWPLYKPDDTMEIRLTRSVEGVVQEVVPWTKLTSQQDAAGDAKHWPRQIRLPLRQTVTVRGKVVDPTTGAPLPGATVSLVSRPENATSKIAPLTTGGDGAFAFQNVPLPTELMVKAIPAIPQNSDIATKEQEAGIAMRGTVAPKIETVGELAGWARVGDGPLSAIATEKDEANQEFSDIVVKPRLLQTVTLQLIDTQTNAPPLFNGASESTGGPSLRITPRAFTSLFSPPDTPRYNKPLETSSKFLLPQMSHQGRLTITLPAGEVEINLQGAYKLLPESTLVKIPPDTTVGQAGEKGTPEIKLKVEREPAIAVRLIRDDPRIGKIKFWVEYIPGTVGGNPINHQYNYGWDKGNEFVVMNQTSGWKFKKHLRVVTEAENIELYSGDVISDPAQWPLDVHLSLKK